jgi:hypothetical protein
MVPHLLSNLGCHRIDLEILFLGCIIILASRFLPPLFATGFMGGAESSF